MELRLIPRGTRRLLRIRGAHGGISWTRWARLWRRLRRRLRRRRCISLRLRRLRLRRPLRDRRLLRVIPVRAPLVRRHRGFRSGISDGSRRVQRRRRCRLRLGMCLTQSRSMIRGPRTRNINPRSSLRRLRCLRQRRCQSGTRLMSIGRAVAVAPHSGSRRMEVKDLRILMGPVGSPHP